MRRIRLYLDTSVIGDFLDARRSNVTREFFRITLENQNEYEFVISPITLLEIGDAKDETKELLERFIKSLPLTEIPKSDEAEKLAFDYVGFGVLTANHIDDLRHIAYAVISHCDYIISWNMKHLANVRTIQRVNDFNMLNNFSRVMIATPVIITGELSDAND